VKERLDKLKRIERLQKRLHDLSIWRLTALARQKDKLAGAHGEMLDALRDGLMAYGGPAAAGTRRIRGLEVEMAAAQINFDAHAEETRDHGVRSRLADRAVDAAAVQYRREVEKKGLAELIEWTLQAAASGSRKA